jgi:Tfp pilus assembly protein PilF
MPRLQDIEQFKRDLAALSHEAEVLARWGEKPQNIVAPEGAAPAPAAEREAEEGPEEKAGPGPTGEDEGLPPDFAQLLDNLPIEGEAEEGAPSAASIDDDLAALLGEGPEEAASKTTTPPSDEGSSLEEIATEPGSAEEAPVEELAEAPLEDFSMPDFGEVASAEEPSPAVEEAVEGESFPDISFDEGMPQPSAAPAEGPSPEEGAPEPSADESFAMPDFDLGEAEPVGAEPEAAPEGAGEEAGAREQPLEDFSIPDFGEAFGKEEEAAAPAEEGEAELEGFGHEAQAGPGATAPSEGGAEDAFETFSFEEPGGGGFGDEGGFGIPSPNRDLDTEIASLSEEAPIADTFKLDQNWGDFGALGIEPGKEAQRQAPAKKKAAPATEKYKPIELTEDQVDRMQDSLLSYPLNLRVAIEDIVANDKGNEAQQSKLIWALVDGAAAEDAALMAGRILKKQIVVPKGYEKRTGAALEAEKGTLAYAFIHTVLPAIKIGLLVLSAAAALGYLSWRFVYVPLAADSMYRTGYQRIAEDRYPEAETDFAKATAMREFVPWYYRYGEAYAAKRQYILAEKKYSSLVAAHPKESAAILAWARLEKEQLKFEEAIDVLKGAPRSAKPDYARGKTGLLSWDFFNEEGLILLGDVYLDWAEEAPAKYEDARRTYASLIEHYGYKDEYLERMLLYFIRVDKLKEVRKLESHFLADPKQTALSAPVLAELGGYLLDKDMLDGVREMLLEAAKKDPRVPEAHYNLARYFVRAGDPTEERKALDKAIASFSALPGLGAKRAGMYIDSLVWRARFLADAKEWLGAERDYATAASEYEKALELRRVTVSGRFGEAYAGLGDVAYWQRDDLPAALAYYERAAENGFSTRDTRYREGNILYRSGQYADALERFLQAGEGGSASPYLLFAFGSALYARNDYFSAEAYFRKASTAMAKELESVGEPSPQESLSEVEALRLYLQSENNLGVALYRSAARSGDARRRNEAMTALTHSVKLYDQLSQAPEALMESEPRDLALDNMNAILKATRGYKLETYNEIEKDMRFPKR